VRSTALQSLVNAGPTSPSVTRGHRHRGFPRIEWHHVPRRPAAPLRARVHPLLSLASSSEFEPPRARPPHGCVERLPWGSVPNRDIVGSDPLVSEVPPSPYGPPSAFLTPSTAYARCHLVGLFHPTATSGIHLPGVFPTAQPCPPRRRAVPSCRCPSSPRRELPRVSTWMTSSSGPCSGWRSVAVREAVSLDGARSPPRFSLLRVFHGHLGNAFALPPLSTLIVSAYV